MTDYHPGLEGVIATESSISDINGQKGILSYRGYSIEELAELACQLGFGDVAQHETDVDTLLQLLFSQCVEGKISQFVRSNFQISPNQHWAEQWSLVSAAIMQK